MKKKSNKTRTAQHSRVCTKHIGLIWDTCFKKMMIHSTKMISFPGSLSSDAIKTNAGQRLDPHGCTFKVVIITDLEQKTKLCINC